MGLYEPTCTNISDDDEETSSEEEEEEDDQDDLATFGLRNRSPLNQLKTFHACVNLPPDLMHDVLEGVVAQDLYGFIKVFVQNGVFSTEEYNRRLKRFGFLSYEAADRPQDVPIKSKALKLPGKACSLWVHIRNFPLIIQEFFEEDSEDDVLLLALKLVDITNRLTAVEFRNHEIEELEDRIIDYLDTRRTIFESYPNLMGSVKPKHHFLVHYGQAIRLFGPPLAFWTARWESKHRIGKNLAESAKNFKNISFTLSYRQQMRMASVYYNGMFQTRKFLIPDNAIYKKDLQQTDSFSVKLSEFLCDTDVICGEIVTNHINYKNGDLVVTNLIDGLLEVKIGLIEAIIVKNKIVWFVTRKYLAVKQSLGYYETEDVDTEPTFTKAENLVDKKPLIKRGTVTKFQFVLHHNISFSNL